MSGLPLRSRMAIKLAIACGQVAERSRGRRDYLSTGGSSESWPVVRDRCQEVVFGDGPHEILVAEEW